ncbi:DUF4389 domain-containing protein [Noviherbaspirillum autotrophicum]|uniref:DUF4389 domain-containing protein n=1 Tax=Noviherbaspirillum autotrophicum TaxID=709839 RepID=UPI000694CB72|nr:DUF4389 domain-containing protein [Noviherbaspirillum autotrophicum]
MNHPPVITTGERSLLVRALFMVLMAFAYQLSGTVLFCVAIIQLVLALVNGAPNARLQSFGRSLGLYMRQLVNFLTFVSEDVPFPFNEWPAGS